MIKSVDKKILIAVIVVTLLIVIAIYYFINKDTERQEVPQGEIDDVINSLTAPSNSSEPISNEVQKSLSAPMVNEEPSEDVINSLTAPSQ